MISPIALGRSHAPSPAALALLVMVLLLVGCSDAADTFEPEPFSASGEFPLEQLFGSGQSGPQVVELWRAAVQEDVVLCMAAKGFEYDVQPSISDSPSFQARSTLTSREWAEQFGYGFAPTYFEQFTLSASGDTKGSAAHLSTLSDSEREAYLLALTGSESIGGGTAPLDLDEQGCFGKASSENGGAAISSSMQDFSSLVNEEFAKLLSRPEAVEALTGWSTCMASKGYEVPEPTAAAALAERAMAELIGPLISEVSQLTEGQAEELVRNPEQGFALLAGYDANEFERVISAEIAMAIADQDCFLDELKPTWDRIRFQAEAAAIDLRSDSLFEVKQIFEEAG